MKTNRTIAKWLPVLALATFSLSTATAFAQGTAFNYQGRLLNTNGSPATGFYDLQFTVWDALTSGSVVAGPMVNSATSVTTNGLFSVTLDFGNGVFTGPARWLEVDVRTNGSGAFTTLQPRQPILPTPYTILANTASNLLGILPAAQLSGSVGNDQLANNSITVAAGTGLSGGGSVALGGSVTLNNGGVVSVTGNADITASQPVDGVVTLDDTATSANAPDAIVKRDDDGSFVSASITLNGNLNLPAPTASVGMIYSGGNPLIQAFGSDNFFAGPGAGNLTMTTLGGNTGVGAQALASNVSGNADTGVGFQALYSNTSGIENTANGDGALFANTAGIDNTANGQQALYSNTNGSGNTANGQQALYSNTSGSNNTANGIAALYSNTTGTNNTANGIAALYSNTTGNGNTANGDSALYANTTGSGNAANGQQALFSNTTGGGNTANGQQALFSNTTGSGNTANGQQALYSNTNGSGNTANGDGALTFNTSGSDNTASGDNALYKNMIASDNVALGFEAGYNLTNGNQNIVLGYMAGYNLTNGASNIEIGNEGNGNDNKIIRIGVQGTQSGTYIAGISGVTISPTGGAVYVNANGQLGTVNSSRRFKEAIQDMASQSDILLSLRPVAFHYKPDLDPQLTPQYGLIAEEVEKVAPELVLRDDKGEVLSVRYEQINAMLLNEFLKEHRTVEAQNTEIQDLKQSVAELKAMVEKLAGK
jgi:hypothetical protein